MEVPVPASFVRPGIKFSEDDTDEVHGQLVRAPANVKNEVFVVRVDEWGGHMLVDCDDPLTVHKVCSTFPAFEFQARPVVPVMDAVRVELEAIAWRDGLKG